MVSDAKPPLLSRRGFFSWTHTDLGGAALVNLLARSGDVRAAVVPGEASDPPPHFASQAKRVIHIVACGGFSQIETLDYKPELAKRHGQTLGGNERPDVFFGHQRVVQHPTLLEARISAAIGPNTGKPQSRLGLCPDPGRDRVPTYKSRCTELRP